MAIMQAKNLKKIFGSFVAVDDISFELKEGEILGFLGPNGAGKTTTLQMLLGVLEPTSGTVSCFGKDLKKNREEIMERINFSSTYTNLPWDLTVRENLTFISYLYEIKDRKKRVEEIRELFKLDEIFKKKVKELSAGQATRVNLAKSFINNPDILLLDEPTASLDPDIAIYIREFLKEKQKEMNISIIFTSHNMAEVEDICDRVIFIDHGKIIANDTPKNLAKSIDIAHVELRFDSHMVEAIELCTKQEISYKKERKYLTVDVKEKEIPVFLQKLMDEGINYTEISIEKPSLEDYFLDVLSQRRNKDEMA